MTSFYLLSFATSAYFLGFWLLVAHAGTRREALGRAGLAATWSGFVVHAAGIGLRWYESYRLPGDVGHAPFANFYESVVFFGWTIVLAYLMADLRVRRRILGVFALPLALACMGWAQLSGREAIEPLMPALRSRWLTYHVISCFLAYGAFAMSFCVSLMYLIRARTQGGGRIGIWSGMLRLFPAIDVLDDMNYRCVAVGFPIWTVGIVTGAAWANYAWGRYWSWDPKETWSLIVWLVYAAFLHARLTRGWSGRATAWLAVGGFAATLFCYLGVNLFLPGLHSYGS
ncbi:MAG: c-type cytochrome biogenesis protein CcsB [Syntrophotalea acetylenica]|jgi:cytochrome c-type biogenesis protein CcsB|uniref:C-type cytochrome biogenesis protein CcsB n=1 Tax=Syntrophotalea acetylenica TaxID=29542 RepID=A0A1L3GI50_SYNAC|nr:c-type cytochrome biogenesis protein CcsB [Syntrophotalea acetylenica]APG25338.1 c-type cytochrome biogenesis protein CcsB [Syntrophotalea acetylenica]APG43407.1 c-type cytochrome biogenesis protein CcsB [Syntrophotalea acetylenica]MDD4457963.1 c-type cytochrome biogenesis protein CcsB [Syntrophotalea acetylenica]MDY0262649.1 c-type cytochrome biogenesis protein CcsB [Syntrophotalea acetylenica]